MKKRGFASFAVASALLFARAASAQTQNTTPSDAPAWLSDRRYNEGIGIRSGDFEIHPGIAGEFGYDSNYFLRSSKDNIVITNGAPNEPVIPSLQLKVTPSLYVSTLSQERREGDVIRLPPAIAFRGGVNATAYFPFGISSDSKASSPGNNVNNQYNVNVGADGRLDIMPERPVSGAVFASFMRVTQADPSDAFITFDRDSIGGGAEIGIQPQSGTLDWHFQYQYSTTLFEAGPPQVFDNQTHEVSTRGRWKFTPRTSLVFDANQRFISYPNSQAQANGLIDSTPIRARLGLNGLVTDRFAATVMAGYGGSFYDNTFSPQQYDSVIGLAELKWFLSASPGVAKATDLGLALSSIALGYQRDFQNSYLGTYYGLDRGYLKFNYFFAGRWLATLEGGVAAIEYPRIQQPESTNLRANAFTDPRADATVYTEYRFSNTFGVNATFRYVEEFSDKLIPLSGGTLTNTPNSAFAMDYQRFEAYIGARWFM